MRDWNPEHLAKLDKGVATWNAWRTSNPDIIPDLEHADLRGLVLAFANLESAYLANANLTKADLTKADLTKAGLYGARLEGACLRNTRCHSADFSYAKLANSDLRGATLAGVDFAFADLRGCDLRSATLTTTIFRDTKLDEANLAGCFMGGTVVGAVDMRNIQGLTEIRHTGPSTIGVDSLMLSEGHVPEQFLRGVGFTDAVITYVPSLSVTPIQFYSCFISYSSADEEIAKRLHAQLQAAGVRCWFAPEDLKIGDRFRQRIDESIRVYEKLLVILSSNSVGSPWVESEVEAAFEIERKRGTPVLLPIRLDQSIMTTDAAWAAEIRRTRHIGDFRDWKNQDGYSHAFDRLMRDLRQQEVQK